MRTTHHRRTAGTLLAVVGMAGATVTALATAPATAGATGSTTSPGSTTSTISDQAARRRHADLLSLGRGVAPHLDGSLGLGDRERLVVRDVTVDRDGTQHLRYDRTYAGLPVRGGDLVVHRTRSGRVEGADRAAGGPIRPATTRPSVDRARAAGTARARAAEQGVRVSATRPELVVWARPSKAGRAALAWETVVEGTRSDGTPSRLHVVTDAATDRLLARWDDIRTGTGHGQYSGWVPLNTQQVGDHFELRDPVRGGQVVHDLDHQLWGSGTVVTDDNDFWGTGTGDPTDRSTAAIDVAYGAARTWDLFETWFGRRGVRGDGVPPGLKVHAGRGYVNAFWDNAAFAASFGDGAGDVRPLTSLDVVGHEIAHGLTAATANLRYAGESGGLNEATSDIVGTAVEFQAYTSADPGDYLVGENVDINGDGSPLRRMDHPSRDGLSADSYYDGLGSRDVHYSSGPANHFFYLLSEGSGPRTINGVVHDSPAKRRVSGIGLERALRIWYRALTVYFTSTTDYAGAREATLRATADLYGATGAEYRSVADAWTAVNVRDDGSTLPENPDAENGTDVEIPDQGDWVESAIEVDRPGAAPEELAVGVDIRHPYRGDLEIELVAPDGTAHRLKGPDYTDSRDDVRRTYVVDASSSPAGGTWRLRIRDLGWSDVGHLDRWMLRF